MAQDQEIKTVRIPFVGDFNQRTSQFPYGTHNLSKDQRFINGYVSLVKNEITGQTHIYYSKRPGISDGKTLGGTIAGMYFWNTNPAALIANPAMIIVAAAGKIYSGNSLANLTDRSGTGGTFTWVGGNVYFSETRPGATPQYVVMYNPDDGTMHYSQDAKTWTSVNTNVGLFGANGLAFLDGYFFVADIFGNIYNSNVDDPTTWVNTNKIVPTMSPGATTFITRQKNNIIVFGDRFMQMYVDAALSPGSPLQNVDQLMYSVGIPRVSESGFADMAVTTEDSTYFIGSGQLGGASVFRLYGNSQLTDIGTFAVRKDIEAELGVASGQNFKCSFIRINGRSLLLISVGTTGFVWVYDTELNVWYQWSFSGSFAGMVNAATTGFDLGVQQNELVFVGISATIGIFNPFNYQDFGSNFSVTAITSRMDLGTIKRKFYHRAELVADTNTSSAPGTLTYYDDDYITLSAGHSIDTANPRMFVKGLGTSRRRAWRWDFSQNAPMRIEALEIDYSQES